MTSKINLILHEIEVYVNGFIVWYCESIKGVVTNKKDVRNNLKTHVIEYFLARNGRFPLAFVACTLYNIDRQFLQNNTPKPSWVWFSQGLEDSWVDQIFPPNEGNSDTTYVFAAAEVILFLLLSAKNHFCFHQVKQQQEKHYWTFLFHVLFSLTMHNFSRWIVRMSKQ